jgi:hypothetical protein
MLRILTKTWWASQEGLNSSKGQRFKGESHGHLARIMLPGVLIGLPTHISGKFENQKGPEVQGRSQWHLARLMLSEATM